MLKNTYLSSNYHVYDEIIEQLWRDAFEEQPPYALQDSSEAFLPNHVVNPYVLGALQRGKESFIQNMEEGIVMPQLVIDVISRKQHLHIVLPLSA